MQESESQEPDIGAAAAPMSMGAKLANVFVAPSEVFDDVRSSGPTMANWIVPLSITVVVGIIYALVVFSQPVLVQTMKDAPRKQLEKKVAQGKISQQLVDQQMEAIDKIMTPEVLKVFGIGGALLIYPAILFLYGLAVWLVGRFALHGSFEYMKAVEAAGLVMMIFTINLIVRMFLALIYGNMNVTLGPSLFVSNFDPNNAMHVLWASIDVLGIWTIAVLSVAVARLSGGAFAKAACWGYGLWLSLIVLRVGFIKIVGG